MSRFNTGNSLPSADSKDLFDNSLAFDEAINSTNPTFLDRLGNSRATWAAIENSVTAAANAAVQSNSTYYVATKAAGDTLAASLENGATVEVRKDETKGNVTTRYTVDAGALTAADAFTQTFQSIADLKAYVGGAVGDVVRTLGYTTAGDGGEALYVAVADSTHTDGASGQTADGSFLQGQGVQWQLKTDQGYSIGAFGGVHGSDIGGAVQNLALLVNELATDVPVMITLAPGDYTMSLAAAFNKSNVVVVAHGARIVPTADVVLFDFNGAAVADGSVVQENITWLGGFFDAGEAATTLETSALRANACRNVKVGYLRTRGVKYPVTAAALSDVSVMHCNFRNFERAIWVPDFLTGDVTDTIHILDNTFSTKDLVTAWAVSLDGGAANVTLEKFRCSFVVGKLVYARTDTGGLSNLTIAHGSVTDADSEIVIDLDANGSGIAADHVQIHDVSFDAPGSTIVSADVLGGASAITACKFLSADQIAINGSLEADAELTIEGNRFAQTSASSGTCWNLVTDAASQVLVGKNLYSDLTATRATDLNTTVCYTYGRHYTVASANALPIEPDANVVNVTGTTDITSMTGTWRGHRVDLIFDDALQMFDGMNLALGTDFNSTAYDTMSLVFDGSKWVQLSTAVN